VFLLQVVCLGATVEDARTLKNDALKLLQAGSNAETDQKACAEAVAKLQKAQQILESLNQVDSTLAQEVNAALFWARRFTVVQIAQTTPREAGAKKAPVPVVPQEPAKKPAEKTSEPATASEGTPGTVSVAAARAKFEAAASFAKENPDDDFVLALRWFQAADELAGTEYSAKALTMAREAQERNLAKQAVAQNVKKEELPDTPGNRLLKEADELAANDKFSEAFPVYTRALVLAPSAMARRKFGLAYFKYAQQLKDKLAPEIEAAEEAYDRARQESRDQGGPPMGRFGRRRSSADSPAASEAKRKLDALRARSAEADSYYDKAWEQFKKTIDSSPGRRNLDAAAHAALCLSLKFSLAVKDAAIIALDEVLANYKPANDVERTLYEFCRSERTRLTK
jgi:tetratricopeptide (TPR) repeat protein